MRRAAVGQPATEGVTQPSRLPEEAGKDACATATVLPNLRHIAFRPPAFLDRMNRIYRIGRAPILLI
jgi:hypothetical protein